MKASAGRRRVLMLLGNNPFPQDVRVTQEASSLVEAGYEVAVVCPRTGDQARRERWRGVDIYRYSRPADPNGPLGYAFEYVQATVAALMLSVRIGLGRGFDVVHAHNPPDTYWIVGAMWKPFGKRFVYDQHDLSPEMYTARFPTRSSRLLRSMLSFLERRSYRLSDHVIVTNDSYRRVAVERGGVDSDNVTVVRNGPNLDRVHRVDPDPELRARAGTILGYVGIMGYQDGLDHLLRSVRHLVYDLGYTDVLAVLVGDGDAREQLQQLAIELGLKDYVWFTGRISDADMLRILSTADICLDPDPSNPFTDRSTMIKMAEYMALAKPIVGFDLPEHRVTARESALYARPNDEYEFARAIAELIDDPKRRESMGALGHQRVQNALQWRHSVPRLLQAYEQVFGDSRRESSPARL
jgi:glycosyltransferase involved in cell wall biosynthesis